MLGFAYNVVNKYFDEYFPRALDTARAMRAQNSSYVYTTHAYLISLFLDCPRGLRLHCPDEAARAAVIDGIVRGDIVWHAFPFNAQVEWAESSLFEFGVHMARTLTSRYNISSVWPPSRVMSQRDVPGATRALVPVLQRAGVHAISFGANEASAPLDVPKIFRWRDQASAAEVVAMYHPSGYGGVSLDECVTVPGLDTALAMAFRGGACSPLMRGCCISCHCILIV